MESSEFEELNKPKGHCYQLLDALDHWLEEQEVVQSFIADAKMKGIDVDRFELRSQTILIESKMLIDVMRERIEQYTLLQYEVLFNLSPRLSRQQDTEAYKELTSIDIQLPKAPDKHKILEEQREILDKDFEELVSPTVFKEIFQFLKERKCISVESDEKIFEKMAKLQPIEPSERLIWIHKTAGKISNQTIAVLFYNAFLPLSTKKHGSKKLDYLIQHYFKPPGDEFKTRTLQTIISALLKDKIILNKTEEDLVELISRL